MDASLYLTSISKCIKRKPDQDFRRHPFYFPFSSVIRSFKKRFNVFPDLAIEKKEVNHEIKEINPGPDRR